VESDARVRPRFRFTDRRWRSALGTWTLAIGLAAGAGATLAVVAIARKQVLLVGAAEQLGLVARWAMLATPAGAALGLTGVLLAVLARRRSIRHTLVGLVLLAGASLPVAAGLRSSSSPWRTLGSPAPYVSPGPRRAREGAPNLVLVTVDTLRADHLEPYGYQRPTAPTLSALARDGVVFDLAISQAPETLHSMAALMTGLYPHVVDRTFELREGRGPFVDSAFHALAERLAAGGYHTGGFVSNPFLRARNGFAQGFEHYDDTSGMYFWGASGRTRQAEDVVDPAIAWLAQAEPPFFLWIHVMDPHHPYEPAVPAPWEEAASTTFTAFDEEYGTLDIPGYTRRLEELGTGRRRFQPGELDYLVGRYDAEIRQSDRAIGRLVEELRSRGFGDTNTTIVVTADHGEEFADHGGMTHGHTLFDELIHVPLIVQGAGVSRGARVGAQVRLIDVAPTLLDLAGLLDGASASGLHGRSLVPALGGAALQSLPALAFCERDYAAYRTRERKLVVSFEPYPVVPQPWPPWRSLLSMATIASGGRHRRSIGYWRLESDPGEHADLLATDATGVRETYDALLLERLAHPPLAVASSEDAGLEESTRERLEALGYAQ
jgi:arylsulfatase A-like enzyme